jgi:hypothetical protein
MISSARVTYDVASTGSGFPTLEPVRLSVSTGACHVQDYLSVDEARELAGALLRISDVVSEGRHGDVTAPTRR